MSVILDCNDTFLDTMTGSVQSPLYPNNYQNSMRCDILMVAPVNYTIMLQFPYLNMATGDSLQVNHFSYYLSLIETNLMFRSEIYFYKQLTIKMYYYNILERSKLYTCLKVVLIAKKYINVHYLPAYTC